MRIYHADDAVLKDIVSKDVVSDNVIPKDMVSNNMFCIMWFQMIGLR